MATRRDLGNKAKPKALTAKQERVIIAILGSRTRGRVAVLDQRASRNRPEEA